MNTPTFTFSDSDQLISHLQQRLQAFPTGVWEFCRAQPSATQSASESPIPPSESSLYVGVCQGRFIYAGKEATLTWAACVDVLQRSLSKLRSVAARKQILQVEGSVSLEQQALLGSMLNKLVSMRLLDYEEARSAFRNNLLISFDHLFSQGAGYAEFTPNYQLVASAPIQGFEFEILISEMERRHAKWLQLKASIPSMEAVPVLNQSALQTSSIPAQQKERLTSLLTHQQTLGQIASRLGKDPLAVASTFANLIQQDLVSLQANTNRFGAITPTTPLVFVVDDSPLLIRQFVKLVTHWGYRVQHSSNPETAVGDIATVNPDVIFMDINMPGTTGFDLIKNIRRTPEIAETPLVLLTAENSVSNKWRAQWANCKFLAKPSALNEVTGFRDELQTILQEIVPLDNAATNRQEALTANLQTSR